MSAVVHARVVEQLTRLRLRYVADRLDAVLNDAARAEPTYLDFLDGVLRQEVDAKQRTRVAMSATALLAALSKGETEGQLADRLMFYTKPKLLIVDELGYLPFERRSALRISAGARRRCRLALINENTTHLRGSVLVSERGQKILSLDMRRCRWRTWCRASKRNVRLALSRPPRTNLRTS
jgi:hypothetical protein